MRHFFYTFLLWVSLLVPLHCQILAPLSLSDFLKRVEQYHPTARQSDLIMDLAEAKLRKAKGGFDPKISGDWDKKQYKDKNYYNHFNGEIKALTPYALGLKAGYEQNSGLFLNPENNVSDGLFAAGIELPLLQGLLIDPQRAALRYARIDLNNAKNKRQLLLNDLFYDAATAYLNWYWWEQQLEIIELGRQLAVERFDGILISIANGDLPGIDSIEAGLQVRSRELDLTQVGMQLENARLGLLPYLWDDQGRPIQAMEVVKAEEPIKITLATIDTAQWVNNHPEIQYYQNVLAQLEVETRLAKEMIKPQVNLRYNFLTASGGNPLAELNPENYKAGITFSTPITFRKESANIQIAQLQQTDMRFTFTQKKQALFVKMEQYKQTWEQQIIQQNLANRLVSDYLLLLEGEKIRFQNGESSLFILNTREQKYVDSRLKALESLIKVYKAQLSIRYVLGRAPELAN